MVRAKQRTPEERRKIRVRSKIKLLGRKRKLTVFRSNRYIWAQIVDLVSGKSLVGLSDKGLMKKRKSLAKLAKTERAFEVGKELAKKAIKLGIKRVAFDRSLYRFHGRVKALADGARAGGLKF